MSVKAIATPAALHPGPLVTRVRSLTVAKVDSIGQLVHNCARALVRARAEQGKQPKNLDA